MVSTADLLDGSVTTPKLADGAVTTVKIANLAVTNAKIANATITAAQIANATITNAQIANATITAAKILTLNADAIVAGIITGLRYRTAVSGERLEIRGDTGEGFIRMYNSGGTEVGRMGYEPTGFGTNNLGITNTSGIGAIRVIANGDIRLIAGGSAGQGVVVASNALGGLPGRRFTVTDANQTADALVVDTNQQLLMSDTGAQSRPDFSWQTDTTSGMMRLAANRYLLIAQGLAAIEWRTNNVYLWGARNNTTASAANTLIQAADGRIFRSTSSARYKTAIKPWDRRHSVLELGAVLFRSKLPADDSRRVRLGLLAENVAEVFPLAAIRDEKGRPDAIDWNTITAGLLAELAALEERVAELEAA